MSIGNRRETNERFYQLGRALLACQILAVGSALGMTISTLLSGSPEARILQIALYMGASAALLAIVRLQIK